MMKTVFTYILMFSLFINGSSQTEVTTFSTLIKSNHNIGLTNPIYDEGSPMSYIKNPDIINAVGAAYSINYTNGNGGTGFDGYPSGSIGGYNVSGTYHPGVYNVCGMPIQIINLKYNFRIKWKPFQENAHDADDKWWATINIIFDIDDANIKPISDNRDFDLVIEFQRYQQDELADKPKGEIGSYYWFARDENQNPVPFSLMIDGIEYQWGVRYKFFTYPEGDPNESKNDKVHVKFIPIDNNSIPSELDHSLKIFIDASKSYLQYVDLPPKEKALTDEKLADPELWIKTVSAGHEVYSGNSTLGQEHFYTVVDDTPPNAPTNLSVLQLQDNIVQLNWDAYTEDSYEYYSIYRSEDDGEFSLIAKNVYSNSFIDNTTMEGIIYKYHVTVLDRSFNESDESNEVSIEIVLGIDDEDFTKLNLYPNPANSIIVLSGDFAKSTLIKIYSVDGKEVLVKEVTNNCNEFEINISDLKKGVFVLKIDGVNSRLIIE